MKKKKRSKKRKKNRNGLSPMFFYKVLKGILIQAYINRNKNINNITFAIC
jgi:hypothetical protein